MKCETLFTVKHVRKHKNLNELWHEQIHQSTKLYRQSEMPLLVLRTICALQLLAEGIKEAHDRFMSRSK